MTLSTPSLTPVSYVVLGLLATLGPATSYDLEQQVAGSVGHFWSFPRSQLYSEPPRLAGLGLVGVQSETAGRRRRTLTLTEQGRAALQAWLAEGEPASTEIRDLGLLRLFFAGSAASPDDVVANARAQAQSHRERLAVYERIAALGGDRHMAATVRLGLAYESAAVAFWDQVASDG